MGWKFEILHKNHENYLGIPEDSMQYIDYKNIKFNLLNSFEKRICKMYDVTTREVVPNLLLRQIKYNSIPLYKTP